MRCRTIVGVTTVVTLLAFSAPETFDVDVVGLPHCDVFLFARGRSVWVFECGIDDLAPLLGSAPRVRRLAVAHSVSLREDRRAKVRHSRKS